MTQHDDASATAALSICESLLLCLSDKGVLSERDIKGLLRDAEQAHTDAAKIFPEAEHHLVAARLIMKIMASSAGRSAK